MCLKIALFFLFVAVVASQKAPDQRGGVFLDVERLDNDGTRIRLDGRKEVFNTNDGRTRGTAYGHAEMFSGGRNSGQKNLGGGFRTDHDWRNGGASFDVNRRNNDGTRVRIDGRQEIFRTNGGRTTGTAYGHMEKNFGGRYHGETSHGGRVKFEHTWK